MASESNPFHLLNSASIDRSHGCGDCPCCTRATAYCGNRSRCFHLDRDCILSSACAQMQRSTVAVDYPWTSSSIAFSTASPQINTCANSFLKHFSQRLMAPTGPTSFFLIDQWWISERTQQFHIYKDGVFPF